MRSDVCHRGVGAPGGQLRQHPHYPERVPGAVPLQGYLSSTRPPTPRAERPTPEENSPAWLTSVAAARSIWSAGARVVRPLCWKLAPAWGAPSGVWICSSTCPTGSSARKARRCPGCPPRLRPDGCSGRLRGAWGGSDDGRQEELDEALAQSRFQAASG